MEPEKGPLVPRKTSTKKQLTWLGGVKKRFKNSLGVIRVGAVLVTHVICVNYHDITLGAPQLGRKRISLPQNLWMIHLKGCWPLGSTEIYVACRESKMGTCIMVGRPVFIRYYEKSYFLPAKCMEGTIYHHVCIYMNTSWIHITNVYIEICIYIYVIYIHM